MNQKVINPFPRTKYNASSALIIVLCFLVLLTVLVLALLSRSVTSGMISQASANVSKSDLYAHGAIDQILGDVRQEIAAGSVVASVTPSTGGPASIPSPSGVYTNGAGVISYIYRPSSPTNAVPALQGPASYANASTGVSVASSTTVWNNLFPNLVKESTRNIPFYTGLDGNAPTRAAGVNSATDPSLNGRSISAMRWNKPLLLPKASATISTSAGAATTISDTSIDPTPVSTFTAPDWILTTADGSNPTALDTSSSVTTSSVNPKSPKFIVGRYAYAIYNEGGLLDANVAGCPGAPTDSVIKAANKFGSGSVPLSTFLSRKGSEGFADLSQLPPLTAINTAEGSSSRAQTLIDSLVGWRNNASIQPGPHAPGGALLYNVNTTAIISNYFAYLVGNTVRFMTTSNTADNSNGQSDQYFTSRQQMISFFFNLSSHPSGNESTEQPLLQDAMMYLTPFSRTLNQPSYWPDPTRPPVVASGGVASPLGNTAYQLDNTFNPPFKSIRAAASFTRNDGSTANVGDPLVKKRFALNRLAWLTCDGPIATDAGALNTGDPNIATLVSYYENTCGMSAAFLAEGGRTNIYNYFGLTWNPTPPSGISSNGTGNYWIYGHGPSDIVGNLSEVAGLNREPDFFELLKASINSGSIAKSINTIGATTYSQIQDSTVSCQILQLGANIIDEANPTGYPTHIVYTFAPSDYRSVFGAMDLPYYTSMAPTAYIVSPSTFSPLPTNVSNGNEPLSNNAPIASSLTRPVSGIFTPAEGTGVLINVPSIWNPYDANGPGVPTGIAPSSFRIAVAEALPALNAFLNPSNPTWPVGGTNAAYSFEEYANFDPTKIPAGAPATTSTSLNNNYNPPILQTNSTYFPPAPWSGYISSSWVSEDSAALTFSNPTNSSGAGTLYREPTVLLRAGTPSGSNLAYDGNNVVYTPSSGTFPNIITEANSTNQFLGLLAQTFPLRWSATASPPTVPASYYIYSANTISISNPQWTVRMEYKSNSRWIPYMEYSAASQYTAFMPILETGYATNGPYLLTPNIDSTSSGSMWNDNRNGSPYTASANPPTIVWDARTGRWGTPFDVGPRSPFIDNLGNFGTSLTDMTTTLMPSTTGFAGSHSAGTSMIAYGVYEPSGGPTFGLKQQNLWSTPGATPTTDFYCDADGTVRRGSGAYVGGAGTPAGGGNINGSVSWSWAANTTVGLMLACTQSYTGSPGPGPGAYTAATNQSQSRPLLLHRPYRSVAELGYVFSDTPYKNIDFFTPESGFGALLDTFCINEDYRSDAVAAGQFDLNTKQSPVIQAILNGAYRDEEYGLTTGTPPTYAAYNLQQSEAISLAQDLVKRTTIGGTTSNSNGNLSGAQPLLNVADLVGRWITGSTKGTLAAPIGWSSTLSPYDGFSADLGYATSGTGYVATPGNTPAGNFSILQRFRETTMRALADSGQAGTWNLMIDLVAQSGRYPPTATGLPQFIVEGERRYWVHVAIDRSTGQIIDENIEPVNE